MSLPDDWTISGILQYGLATAVLLFILNVFLESNVRNLIEEHHWDKLLSKAVSKMKPFRDRHSFWFAFGLVTGGMIVAWIIPLTVPNPSVVAEKPILSPPKPAEIQEKQASIPEKENLECPQFVNQTPEQLMELYDGHLSSEGDRIVAPYIGQCIRVERRIVDTSSVETLRAIPTVGLIAQTTSTVTVQLAPSRQIRTLNMFFSPEWGPKLAVMGKNQVISAICQIKSINSNDIRLDHCQIEQKNP